MAPARTQQKNKKSNQIDLASPVKTISEQGPIFTRQEAMDILDCPESFLWYFYKKNALVMKMATINKTQQYVFTAQNILIIRLMQYLQAENFKREEMINIARHAHGLNLSVGLDLYWIDSHLMAIEVGNYHDAVTQTIGELTVAHVLKDRSQLIEHWVAFLANTTQYIHELYERGIQKNIFAFSSRAKGTALDPDNKPKFAGWRILSSQHPDLMIPSWDVKRTGEFSRAAMKELNQRQKTDLTYKEVTQNPSTKPTEKPAPIKVKVVPNNSPAKAKPALVYSSQAETNPGETTYTYSIR